MKKIYKRIKVNKELLKPNQKSREEVLSNEVHDTLPAGKVVGVYFNSYVSNVPQRPVLGGGGVEGGRRNVAYRMPNIFSHTDIILKDSRGHQLTEPTNIQDYEHKGGGYVDGFKELDFESKNEKITIAWETLGGSLPILGEFIFAIEVADCAC